MEWYSLIILILAGVGLLASLVFCVGTRRAYRERLVLSSGSHDGPPADSPKLSVLIPAKDEELDIERCVRSILDQDYPNTECIVIDDRSTDNTPLILRALQEEYGERLIVKTVIALPEGWVGKINAMRVGVAASTGDWLCFTDADCWQTSTDTLSMAMREAMDNQIDFLSMTPVIEMPTVWEKIINPACLVALGMRLKPHRTNAPNKRHSYANGAFMLMTRQTYDTIIQDVRLRSSISEDMLMAHTATRLDCRMRVLENEDLYRTRMYRSLRETWHGWTRIFHGAIGRPVRLAKSIRDIVLGTVMPQLSCLAVLLAYAAWAPRGNPLWLIAIGYSGAAMVISQYTLWRLYRNFKIHPSWSLLYLLGAMASVTIMLNAGLNAVGWSSTLWRGTRYRVLQSDGSGPQPCADDHDMRDVA